MTICIAALCNKSKEVIVVSDRMITVDFPPIEFEHGIPKLEEICSTCVVLTSGDALAHADICRQVRENISGLVRPSIENITEATRKSYVQQRQKRATERFLQPRGWTMSDFYGKNMSHLPTELALTIDNQIASFNFGLSMIVAGADPQQAHIYGIRHPGQVDCYDALGYHAIGIGAMHASSSLIANGYTPDIDTKWAVYWVYEAKRSAECAPGVGRQTDMSIITGTKYISLTEDQMARLEAIYSERRIPKIKEIEEEINNLPF